MDYLFTTFFIRPLLSGSIRLASQLTKIFTVVEITSAIKTNIFTVDDENERWNRGRYIESFIEARRYK